MLEMKIAVGVVLLSAILPGGVLAAEPVQPSLSAGHEKVVLARQVPSTGKKARMVRKIADNPPATGITNPVTKDNLTGTPPASTDQSVELRGVRG
jgi:hypothetical protein